MINDSQLFHIIFNGTDISKTENSLCWSGHDIPSLRRRRLLFHDLYPFTWLLRFTLWKLLRNHKQKMLIQVDFEIICLKTQIDFSYQFNYFLQYNNRVFQIVVFDSNFQFTCTADKKKLLKLKKHDNLEFFLYVSWWIEFPGIN